MSKKRDYHIGNLFFYIELFDLSYFTETGLSALSTPNVLEG